MKPREPRRKVMIKARMRVAASWDDICIINISGRGMSMQSASPPPRGTYLEVRRGYHVIMACVMWSSDHRFGVRTQDNLVINDIIRQPQRPSETPGKMDVPATFERRLSQRSSAQQHENSRMVSRAMEFAVMGALAFSVAVAIFTTVAAALHAPLAEVSAALAR